jgi:hypothetical protein
MLPQAFRGHPRRGAFVFDQQDSHRLDQPSPKLPRL